MRAACWLSSRQGGVADSPSNRFVRDYLVHHAHIITALRLPDTLFMQTGGIEVGSDLIILQKDSHKQNLTTRERLFLETCRERTSQGLETEHANKAFSLPQSTLSTGTTIGTNQFGKLVRKYEWNGTEEAIHQRLAEILRANFTHYFKPSLFGGQKQAQPQQGAMLSLFDLFGEATDSGTVQAKHRQTTLHGRNARLDERRCVGAVRGATWYYTKQKNRPFFRNDRMV